MRIRFVGRIKIQYPCQIIILFYPFYLKEIHTAVLNCCLCCSLLSPLSLMLLQKPEVFCSLEACSHSPLFFTRSLLRSDFCGSSEGSLPLHPVLLAVLWHVYLCLPLSACLAPFCGPVAMCWVWVWQGSVWAADVRREVQDVKWATGHGDTAHMGLT